MDVFCLDESHGVVGEEDVAAIALVVFGCEYLRAADLVPAGVGLKEDHHIRGSIAFIKVFHVFVHGVITRAFVCTSAAEHGRGYICVLN